MLDSLLPLLARSTILVLLDLVILMRIELIHDFKKFMSYRDSDFILPNMLSFLEAIPQVLVPAFIALTYNVCVYCFFATPVGIILSYFLLFLFLGSLFGYASLVMAINGMFSPYTAIRRQIYSYILLTAVVWLFLCTIIYWIWIARRVRRPNTRYSNAIPICLLGICVIFWPFFVAEVLRRFCTAAPVSSLMPPNKHSYKNLLYFQSKSFKSLNHRYSTQVCVDATNAEESLYYNYQSFAFNPFVCLLNSPLIAPVFSRVCSTVVHFFPILWLLISSFLIFYKFIFQTVFSHLRRQFQVERLRLNELQVTGFIQYHWNRLDVLKCFMLFWIIKTSAVVLLGPDYFPLFSLFAARAKSKGLSESFFDSVSSHIPSMLRLIQHPDPSLFIEYGKYLHLVQPTVIQTLHVFLIRLLCAILVHGTESWISFFATVIVLGWISARFLTAIVYIFDFSGSIFKRFDAVLEDPPGDIDVWNALEDTEDGNQRFHFVAAEMLHGADFFCIIPFVILAIQYDISKLCMIDRAYLFLHGMILTVIMFFYCFEAIIRSKMLDLFDRNSQARTNRLILLISHIQLISSAFVVSFSTFKAIFYLLGSTDFFQPVQALDASADLREAEKLAYEVVFEGRRGLFSATALSARRVKLIMCGIQWSINIVSNLLEYTFLLYRVRNPDWAQFDKWVWWVRLVTAVTDYIFTVMSFFMILWLSIFDSFGVFRTLILLTYLYFVIYPTAQRGYTWLRWRLFFTIRIMTMRNPSQRELDIEGDNCAICYEVMTPKTGKVTRCGHYFHLECLTLWMKRNPTCPMCHADMLSKNVRNMRLIRYEESIIEVSSESPSAKTSTPTADNNTNESSTSAARGASAQSQ